MPILPKKRRRPASTLPASRPLRRCRYCHAQFKPDAQPGGKPQVFCCPQHRKNYHRYGGLPFDKLQARLDKEIRKLVPTLVKDELRRLIEATADQIAFVEQFRKSPL